MTIHQVHDSKGRLVLSTTSLTVAADLRTLLAIPRAPEIYRDPLAPELANPYRWVDGYKIVDSTLKT